MEGQDEYTEHLPFHRNLSLFLHWGNLIFFAFDHLKNISSSTLCAWITVGISVPPVLSPLHCSYTCKRILTGYEVACSQRASNKDRIFVFAPTGGVIYPQRQLGYQENWEKSRKVEWGWEKVKIGWTYKKAVVRLQEEVDTMVMTCTGYYPL